jgi:hypothetical protein
MQIGDRRGLRPPRIHDDEHAAPLPVGAQARAHVGSRHQAAVGDQRVCAENEEEVGAVDVGNGEEPGIAVHQATAHVLRELVHGRAREHPLGVESLDEECRVEHRAEVVARRIADVGSDGVLSVLLPDVAQARSDPREGLLPADLLPAGGGAAERATDAVRVLMDAPQRGGLRAEVAETARIVFIAADLDDGLAPAIHLEDEPTAGLADRAGAVNAFNA